MRCEVIAVGTELLLGQIVDTNSSYIGGQLASSGIDCMVQTKVGDNHDRMADALRGALARADAVIMCGGLGPTQDDITREVIADVLGVELETRDDLTERISAMFGTHGRSMPKNNLRQAMVPAGGKPIPVQPGTAPGLCCTRGDGKVVYAVPGVPWEMKAMIDEFVIGDLRNRAGLSSVITSRVIGTWGQSESGLAELLADEIVRLDSDGGATLAFLASGMDGLKIRVTAKAESADAAERIVNDEVDRVRSIIGDDLIFGYDDDTIESVVLDLCRSQGLRLGIAESLTGGLIGQRLTAVPGASEVVAGSIVSYSDQAKQNILGLEAGCDAISDAAVRSMAEGAASVLRADCAVAVTGVAGPAPVGDHQPGTVFMATIVDGATESFNVNWPFDRQRIREFTTITVLNQLRRRLAGRAT